MSRVYTVTLDLTVVDPQALHREALRYAIEVDNLDREYALGILGTEDEPDIEACLAMRLDPGYAPGCAIQSTCVEAHKEFDHD